MHFSNYCCFVHYTFIANICSYIENLRVCCSAEAGIVLNLFLATRVQILSKNEPRVFIKLFLLKSVILFKTIKS